MKKKELKLMGAAFIVIVVIWILAMVALMTSCNVRTITLTPHGNKTIQYFNRADVKAYRKNTANEVLDTLRPVKIIMIPKTRKHEKN